MKTSLKSNAMMAIRLAIFVASLTTAYSQGTAFTYQGRLDADSTAASGIYDLRFTIYDLESGGAPQGSAVTNSASAISNGLFTVTLDFGATVFDGNDRWLEIAVRTNGGGLFAPLNPRQRITSTPYAFKAATVDVAGLTGTISSGQITDGTISAIDLAPNAVGTFAIADGSILAADLQVASFSSTFWRVNGNAGTTADFLGTTDNQPLEIRVNNLRALRLEDNGDGSDGNLISDGAPNLIGGSPGNHVAADVVGATIGGGGALNWFGFPRTNAVRGDYGTVGGGLDNQIDVNTVAATIAGGFANRIGEDSDYTTIGGGNSNDIGDASTFATIAGGNGNHVGVDSDNSTIAGGRGITIGDDSPSATIGGGVDNSIQFNGDWSTIGGGEDNLISSNAWRATIAGGGNNFIGVGGSGSVVGGGINNLIADATSSAVIAGGSGNNIGEFSGLSTIGGGIGNSIGGNSFYSVIGGGYSNRIRDSVQYGVLPGGRDNELGQLATYAFAAGRRAKANHAGSFIWADSQDADFASTANNQFNVRAAGGARFVTSGAGLTVDGASVFTGNNGSSLTALNASQLTSGTVPSARIAGTYSSVVAFSNSGNTLAGNGVGLTSLNASELSNGTVPDARLSANVARENQANTFTAVQTISTASSTSQLKINQSTAGNFARLLFGLAGVDTWILAAGGDDHDLNFYYAPASNNRMTLTTNGNLLIDGTLNPPSDRNRKQDFAAVDAVAVLEKVAALPIQSWAYKNSPETRHIGPVAQDFHAAFQFNGEDDKHIATVDADGVALAAIQGLNAKVESGKQKAESLEQRLEQKETEITELKQRLEKLERLLAVQLAGGAK